MARINIEDSLFKDNRFLTLVITLGNFELALGAVVHAWIVAQKWYATPEKMVPLSEWKKQGLNDVLFSVNLAEKIDQKVKISGAAQQFAWINQLKEAGKRGGLKTQANFSSEALAKLKGFQPSYSYSSSSSKKKNNTCSFSPAELAQFNFDLIYTNFPRKLGKGSGMKKCSKEIKTIELYNQLTIAVKNFTNYHKENKTDLKFVPYFSTFMNNWRDWIIAPSSSSNNIRALSQMLSEHVADL